MQLPLTIVQRTNIPCLEPTRDAVEMESVLHATVLEVQRSSVIGGAAHVADPPGSVALFTAGGYLVGLAIDA